MSSSPPQESTEKLGHAGVVPPAEGPAPSPVDPAVLEFLARTPATDVSDAVGRLYTMDPAVRPLYGPMRRLAGVAVTAKAPPGDNWAIHAGLGRAFPGSVLVVDWRGHTASCGGGHTVLQPAIARGLAGLVIDGAWRDVEEIAASGFPVCGRGVSAFSPGKRELGELNVPVNCGGVIVRPGDLVIGDADGVAVIPRAHLDAVLAELRRRAESEASGSDEGITRIRKAYARAAAEAGEVEAR